MSESGVFDDVRTFPDPGAGRTFAGLVGLDEAKGRLLKEAQLMLNPAALDEWARTFHVERPAIVERLKDRPPLFLFAGDVGTGKTALAESFGDPVARELGVPVTLYCLSLSARGNGAVGQMTALIASAFDEVRATARDSIGSGGDVQQAVVLLVDEADALAQSREAAQMHHEDRAGVNAVIRGIDALAQERLPVLVVMCTNRLDAIDPAVRRRAAATFSFVRPNEAQRRVVLQGGLKELGLTDSEIAKLVEITGPNGSTECGFTFSDLTQRLLPAIVLDAFPSAAVTAESALAVAATIRPTPPFRVDVAGSGTRPGSARLEDAEH